MTTRGTGMRTPRSVLAVACLGALAVAGVSPAATLPAATQTAPQLAGCDVFPADDIWNTPVDTLPLDPASDTYIATIGADVGMHADFGAGLYEGAPIGIPFLTLDAAQPPVDVSFLYAEESDPGPYPVPVDAPIEGGPDGTGDRHVLVVDGATCTLSELFNAFPQDDGSWQADSGAVYDLGSSALRPDGWTSADAAGLPVLPGLVRYDEVAAGEIRHALRFTVPDTRREYVWPARHFASKLTDPEYPPMGLRFRLRPDFDTTDFSPPMQVILRALQTYGMILADNGSAWFLSGAPDDRWDNDMLRELGDVLGSDFQAVDVSSLMTDPNSGQVAGVGSAEARATTAPVGPAFMEADLFVDDSNETGIEDGSAGSPYSTLAAALDAAADGDTIAVAAGDYPGNVRVDGRTISLLGGFSGDFTTRDPASNVTTLLGDGTDAVVTLTDAGDSVVDGFRITGGTNSSVPEYGDLGGGVYITGGAPTISNNLIEDNDARPATPGGSDPLGGGIFAGDSNVSIVGNVIRGNTAGRGGGIAVTGGTVLIEGNEVTDNVGVSDHGGGLYIASPAAEITGNLISGNEIGREIGYGWGGGIIVFGEGSSATLSFNEITGNYAPSVGGGVFVDDGAVATLDHELIHHNVCPDGGTTGGVGIYVDGYDTIGSTVTISSSTVAGHDCLTQGGNGLYVEVNSAVTITNSIFWDNGGDDFIVDDTSSIDATYTLSEESLPGEGDLSADPLFMDADAGDFHVLPGSPTIDTGDPAARSDREPEPNGGRVDLGRYSNTSGATTSEE